MKISIIIVSTLLVLGVFIPFFLFIYNGTKNSSNIKKQFVSHIKNNDLGYLHQEIWHHYFIGLCNDKKRLTYMNGYAQNFVSIHVLLSEVKSCNIIKNIKRDKNKTLHLEGLSLEFVFKSEEKQPVMIAFFNSDDDFIEDYELARIEKWHKIIKDHLSNNKHVHKKAS